MHVMLTRNNKSDTMKTVCPDQSCDCLAILGDANACAPVMKYSTWFKRRTKYKQDSIRFE
jgi:hypothetical protein